MMTFRPWAYPAPVDWRAPEGRRDQAAHHAPTDRHVSTAFAKPANLRSRSISSRRATGTSTGFLPHIEGLRGIAVLAVLWFHMGLPGAIGGFTGVDVFFVVSGFLITGLLLREHAQTGRIDLGRFYSRRMRRILPAALVTVALTVVLAAAFLAPLQVPGIAQDGAASALSIGNIRFAVQSTDYFAETDVSPFRHFWSLGVEEQFYLVWPGLLLLVLGSLRSRLKVGIMMVGLLAASLAFAVWLTDVVEPWAFYSLPSRVWQLALGGLLAVAFAPGRQLPRWLATPIGWLGLGLLAAAFVLIDPASPYPGLWALLPAGGAAAVILGGGRGLGTAQLLGWRPLRFVGRISYSLYLWHWPILTLPALALGQELPVEARLGLGALSIVVGAISWRIIEEPFWHGSLSAFRPRPVLATAVATAIAVAVLAVGIGEGRLAQVQAAGAEPVGQVAGPASPPPGADSGRPSASQPLVRSPTASDVGATTGPTSPPATSPSPAPPSSEPLDSAAESLPPGSPIPIPSELSAPHPWALPAGLQPPLASARDDKEALISDGCFSSLKGSAPKDCTFGDPTSAFTVALVGDSHASHWFPAIERIATANGWRLITYVKASCVFVDLPIFSPLLKREYTECEAWRPLVIERLVAEQPDLVIVSSDRWLPPVNKIDEDPTRQGEAMARLLREMPGRVAILADTPAMSTDVPVCLSAHLDDITRCATSWVAAFGHQHLIRERTAAAASGATLIDLSDAICPADPCQPVVRGMIVYRDDHHLTATFAASLAAILESRLPIPR
jgi:peptidoglycan/LPS O-acetylase OafA/YrhL